MSNRFGSLMESKRKYYKRKYYEVEKLMEEMDGVKHKEVFDILLGMRAVLGWVSGEKGNDPIEILKDCYKHASIWEEKSG
jgi:hypothetical protein